MGPLGELLKALPPELVQVPAGLLLFIATMWAVEAFSSEEGKKKMWLGLWDESHPERGAQMMEALTGLINRIYGEKHWTWTCFAKSAITSLTIVAMSYVATLALTSVLHSPSVAGIRLGLIVGKTLDRFIGFPTVMVIGATLFGSALLISDFLSLFQTRVLVSYARRAGSRQIAALLLLDVALTLTLSLGLPVGVFWLWWSAIELALTTSLHHTAIYKFPLFWGVLASGAVTTLGLVLLIIGRSCASVLRGFRPAFRIAKNVLDTEKRPLTSIALVISLAFLWGTMAWVGVRKLVEGALG